jgi:transcription elongation factor Elf1
MKPKSRNKYHNKAVTVDNIRFASMAESKRYLELKALKQAGLIQDFILQPKFPILEPIRKCNVCNHKQPHVKGSQKKADIMCRKCGKRTTVQAGVTYIADFLVIHIDGTETIEDVKGTKGFMDPVFKIKSKFFDAKYPEKTIKIVIMNNRKVKT